MFLRKNTTNNFLDLLEVRARKVLPKPVFDHIAGGAGDELTLNRNRDAYSKIALVPKVLIDVNNVDTSISIFGTKCKAPIIIAPMAFHALASPEKEMGTANAAHEAGCIMTVSMMANTTLEEVASTASSLWFQLHIHSDHEITERLIKRAENSGYKAIVVTIDIPQMGKRNRDIRNEFKLPSDCIPVNFIGKDKRVDLKAIEFNASATWEDIKWIKSRTKLPILLKGILHPNDAIKAIDCGADGIIVSNHGGRQLDGALSTIEALHKIAFVVKDKIPILIDGGIRNGTDILKAIALGADAVLVGRPILWGLATAGKIGALHVMRSLTQELTLAMQLVGCKTIDNIKGQGKSLIFDHENLFMNYDLSSAAEIKSLKREIEKLSMDQNKMVRSLSASPRIPLRAKL